MQGPPDASPDLLRLETVADVNERNALALRLAEARTPNADAVLARLILRPDLVNHRGTLVHALSYYDCSPRVLLLVKLVISGNFEVAHEALEALETIEAVEADELVTAFQHLECAVATVDPQNWRKPLLDDLAEMFD